MSTPLDKRIKNLEQENAELRRRLDGSLDQQTATSDILRVIAAVPGDAEGTLQKIAETTMRLFNAAGTSFRIADGDAYRSAIVVGHGAEEVSAALSDPDHLVRPRTLPGTVIHENRQIHLPDLDNLDPAFADWPGPPVFRAVGMRTVVGTPLRRGGQAFGALIVYRDELRPFTPDELALLQSFADQAVIAMENARLITETQEALDQQTATAEVLQVINASPGDLAPVFDAMLERALRLCEAALGVLFTYDGEYFHLAAHRGFPRGSELLEMGRDRPQPGPDTGFGRIVRGERLVHIVDITDTDAYRNNDPIRRATADVLGARTSIFVALVKDDVLLGGMHAYRREVRPFTDKQIALLQNFAAQAVIAMENARLLTETREALDQQTATAEVLGVINASPGDLAPVFDVMVERAAHLCEADEAAVRTCSGTLLHLAATYGTDPSALEQLRKLGPTDLRGLYEPFARGDDIAHYEDARDTDAYRNFSSGRNRIDARGIRSWLAVALRKEGTLLGIINVHRRNVRPFTDKQIALLRSFAAQAVIAIENARLITETREALDQQTATAEVLQVINSSPGDLMPVFEAILDKAHALCGAERGTLFLYDGEKMKAAVAHGYPADVVEHLRAGVGLAPQHAPLFAGNHVHIADLRQDGNPTGLVVSGRGGVRTNLLVPLFRNGALLGMISCNRTEVRPFSDKEIALIENFAQQAVIAIENARLLTETREALDQQTATAEVLGVINASPGELQPVFDIILEKAMALCDVSEGDLELYDGNTFRAVATLGLTDAFAEQVRRGYPASDNPATRPLIAGERFSHIANMADADFSKVFTHEPVKDEGHHTLLCVPLRREGRLLGMIASARTEVRPFSEKEIALLENFAAQAVIAMENARLITETQEALDQQTATAEVLGVINSSPGDLTPVFEAIAAAAATLCDAANCAVFRFDGSLIHLVAQYGLAAAQLDTLRDTFPLAPGRGSVTARAIMTRQVAHVPDLTADAEFAHPSLVEAGLRGSVSVPMLREGVVIGAITVTRQEIRSFSDKQIALLENFAAQAAIAMENARLLGELRQRTDEVAELNRGLEARVAEQVDELGRVGRLKRFLAPQLAELIVSQGDENILESHRREIVVVFCDLRGYTAFTETAEPEEVLDFLREYHGALGPLVAQFEGTLDQFSGDGIMVFFNDPVPIPDPAERAVEMAMAMREAAADLVAAWRRRGRELGFGVGIAQGYATLGQIGFAERSGYTAIGTVCNVAARLCAEAKHGQILLSQRVAAGLDGSVALEELGALPLKGLTQPVVAFNVVDPGPGANRLRLV
jgi:GAF domain-containing protein